MAIIIRSPIRFVRDTDDEKETSLIQIVRDRVEKRESGESFSMKLKRRALASAETAALRLRAEIKKEMQK